MDLDPFEPLGINAATMRFLDVFLLHCLVSESPPDTPDEIAALARNQHRTASHGREPGLMLERGAQQVSLVDWAGELLQQCRPLAERLDAVHGTAAYSEALQLARQRLQQPETTPSARALQVMQSDFNASFAAFVLAQAEQTRSQLMALPFPQELATAFKAEALTAVAQQRALEVADSGSDFEAFRLDYLSPQRLLLAA